MSRRPEVVSMWTMSQGGCHVLMSCQLLPSVSHPHREEVTGSLCSSVLPVSILPILPGASVAIPDYFLAALNNFTSHPLKSLFHCMTFALPDSLQARVCSSWLLLLPKCHTRGSYFMGHTQTLTDRQILIFLDWGVWALHPVSYPSMELHRCLPATLLAFQRTSCVFLSL